MRLASKSSCRLGVAPGLRARSRHCLVRMGDRRNPPVTELGRWRLSSAPHEPVVLEPLYLPMRRNLLPATRRRSPCRPGTGTAIAPQRARCSSPRSRLGLLTRRLGVPKPAALKSASCLTAVDPRARVIQGRLSAVALCADHRSNSFDAGLQGPAAAKHRRTSGPPQARSRSGQETSAVVLRRRRSRPERQAGRLRVR